MFKFRLAALAMTIVSTSALLAGSKGPHLGMKLACKRYGEAWNSGSKGALFGASTSDFAYQWGRMPDHVFAGLPRGGASGVAGSFKSRGGGYGEVSVNTSQGPMTFILVGHGFNWTVADIHKIGDDGQWVSLKGYLDASLTAREFMAAFHEEADQSFRMVASTSFNGVFGATESGDLTRVRRVLPPPNIDSKPHLVFHGNTAQLTVNPSRDGNADRVVIRLVHEGSWKVNDFEVNTSRLRIASFKSAIPALACVTALGAFVENPTAHDPANFTATGELRDALQYARSQKPFPMKSGEKWTRLEIAEDGATVLAHYPTRVVRMSLAGERLALCRLEMAAPGGKWSDVAHALAIQKRVKEFSVASALQLPLARPRAAAVAGVLEKASAVEQVVQKTALATAKVVQKTALPTPKRLEIASPKAADVEVAQAVAVKKTTREEAPVATEFAKAEAKEPAAADNPIAATSSSTIQPAAYFVQPRPAPHYYYPQQARRCRNSRWR